MKIEDIGKTLDEIAALRSRITELAGQLTDLVGSTGEFNEPLTLARIFAGVIDPSFKGRIIDRAKANEARLIALAKLNTEDRKALGLDLVKFDGGSAH